MLNYNIITVCFVLFTLTTGGYAAHETKFIIEIIFRHTCSRSFSKTKLQKVSIHSLSTLTRKFY